MGDAWTKSLPLDWMKPYISRLAASPHFYLALTKNHKRMIRFWLDVMGGRVPSNFHSRRLRHVARDREPRG
jgi:hypothetical protein